MLKIIFLILTSSFFLPPASSAELDESIKTAISISFPKKGALVAGWNPDKNKKGSQGKASKKTLIALEKFKEMPQLEQFFKNAKGFAVFPNIGKAGFGIGASRGIGEVFKSNQVIGSTTVTQISIGLQLGGQAFSQIIFFKDQRDIDRFTEGNFEFGAAASAALIKAGASVEAAYSDGIAVLTLSKGGLMYEASIGGQKFSFEPYRPAKPS